ncbi:hypothetical protein Nhal_0622 [Nitrosococcus halophilus Nc 4]|uniref:CopG domain protein DNA-binding domain protein n=1 Tax=Nitrosococcus halophilus (strain Nc4) TaxID=472759 RepID=D5BWS3_NITHN|nr:CopG family transcriptional regulator [Nitrosococcus halophilus]ADE13804.1 hypothetical protein Nhal_0622 [Nitrosococcus halophilus Nc 4]
MGKKKTTVYLDEDLLRATKVMAARSGRREYQIVEEALRRYLGLESIRTIGARSELDEDQALVLAYREIHAERRQR